MTIEVEVPGRGHLRLDHLVLDVNGTLALDGVLIGGVATRLRALAQLLSVHLVTADTHGRQAEIDRQLGMRGTVLAPGRPDGPRKAEIVRSLRADGVVAIGNGANDAAMLKEAALGIAVLGPEGLAVEALAGADLLCPTIAVALDLLLNPRRLVATLRR